jgi:signal transduction histidine kinase
MFAALSTILVIAAAGLGLIMLFDHYAEQRTSQELNNYLTQLSGSITVGPDGKIDVDGGPPNPRFSIYESGLYWTVVNPSGKQVVRSPSLGQANLAFEAPLSPDQEPVSDYVLLSDGHTALLHARAIDLDVNGTKHSMILGVAIDMQEIHSLRDGFAQDMIPGLAAIGGLFILGAWAQVTLGLRPLRQIRTQIAAVRAGARYRLSHELPSEVWPLVQEVNTLLDAQEHQIEQARNHAINLAHGIKTPLTALATDIKRLRAMGEDRLAQDIETLANQMRHTVERELARSRQRHTNIARRQTTVAPVVDALLRTLSRTPDGELKTIENRVDPDFVVSMEQDDLTDVLGNVLENAVRAAHHTIIVRQTAGEGHHCLMIEDDGSGIETERLAILTERGTQLSENSGSAGLGLSIVAAILHAYGGEISFGRSTLGGLQVEIHIPASALNTAISLRQALK